MVNPWDLDPDDVNLDDIVQALSNICRFTGHTSHHHSVLKHSIVVAHLANAMLPERAYRPGVTLAALFHDAAEAYLNDVVTPIKRGLSGYAEAESRAMDAIYEGLGLPVPGVLTQLKVIAADQAAFWLERHLLVDECEEDCLNILKHYGFYREDVESAVCYISHESLPSEVRGDFWQLIPKREHW